MFYGTKESGKKMIFAKEALEIANRNKKELFKNKEEREIFVHRLIKIAESKIMEASRNGETSVDFCYAFCFLNPNADRIIDCYPDLIAFLKQRGYETDGNFSCLGIQWGRERR